MEAGDHFFSSVHESRMRDTDPKLSTAEELDLDSNSPNLWSDFDFEVL